MFRGGQSAGSEILRCLLCFFGRRSSWARLTIHGAAWHNASARGAMISKAADYLFLVLAAAPFIYYLLVLNSSWRFFRNSKGRLSSNPDFTPPLSNLKPVPGLDPEPYQTFPTYFPQTSPLSH